LACPYRFYLRHVLKLDTLRDDADELDGAAFGLLAHEVLRRFGSGPARDSTDPAEIRRVLDHELNQCVATEYGRHALPSVYVQIEQLRIRLHALAEHQAEWARRGWRIQHTEVPGPRHEDALLSVDGQDIRLTGRIDRIDVHRETGRHVILDYKTSDSPQSPEQVHRRGGHWTDLQLPLYRHLVRSLGIDGPCELGYVSLPKDIAEMEFQLAQWTETELREADEVAHEVVRRIRREEFWPPADPAPEFSSEFAPICQALAFEKESLD
jgi:RecB family exonuclease